MAVPPLSAPIIVTGEIPRPCWEAAEAESDVNVALEREEVALQHRDRFAYSQKDAVQRIYGSAGVEDAPETTEQQKSDLAKAGIANFFLPKSKEIPTTVYVEGDYRERDFGVVEKFRSGKIKESITDINIKVSNVELCESKTLEACEGKGLTMCIQGRKECKPEGLVGNIIGTLTRRQDENDQNLCHEEYRVSAIILSDHWANSPFVLESVRTGIWQTMFNSAKNSCEQMIAFLRARPAVIQTTAQNAKPGPYTVEISDRE